MRNSMHCALLVIAALSFGRAAIAAEAGTSSYLKGYKDFLSGIVPPEPGFYLRNDLIYYTGDIGKTVIGGRVDLNFSEWYVMNVTAGTYVSPYQILGGTYAAAIAVPIMGANVTASASSQHGHPLSARSVETATDQSDFNRRPDHRQNIGRNAQLFLDMA
jgi:hypothetical protein